MVTQEQLLIDAHDTAIKALKNFFNNLDFNVEAFNHLYNIEVFAEPMAIRFDEAEYRHTETKEEDPTDNTIVVNKKRLEYFTNLINNNKANKDTVTNHIATAIVHEMLHANRMILQDYVTKKTNYKNKKLPNINEKPEETWKVKANIPSEFYHKYDYLSEEEESDRIYYQGDFEEAITDTIAVMIIKTRNKNKFDLDEINDELQQSQADEEVKIGSKILTSMGIDSIKWFMTSAYENSYYDMFEDTFKDKYNDLLYDISDIHTSVYCNQQVDKYSIYNANKIIEEKTNKKR